MKYDRKDDINFIKWAKSVKQRDHYECQTCGRRGTELHAHHKNGWNWCFEERFDIDNGVTLCSICHHSFHNIYKAGDNTAEQFEEFAEFCRKLIFEAENVVRTKTIIKNVTKQCREDGYLDGYTA